MKKSFSRVISLLLCLMMLVGMLPIQVAATIQYTEEADDYYKLISKKDWELAPGIVESEIVINNAAGDRRQVMHVVEVDVDNEYTKVIPSIKGMVPTPGQYGVQTMDKQAAYAEENGYGNVVAAMNISLSWYDSVYYDQNPQLVGEPLGYMILDGEMYANSQGMTSGAQTCLVINFDEKDGVARPADMPKTEIRSTSSPITGWEEQVIPANFGFLVKDGKMVNATEEHTSEGASRSMLGIKADGTIVVVMNDGRQAPYSTGFNNYEMSEAMLKLGCVYAINGDGGGSSQFYSQRPGEEMELHCSPSDGSPRPTTHGVLVISTAPSTGEFVRAHVEAEGQYYTPGSSVQFNAIGSDLAGGAAEIPAEAQWQLSDDSFGTIDDNGVFVSNGKVGEVTAQLTYNGEVKGSATINIVVPTAISFGTAEAYTVPFGESVTLNVTATYDVFDVVINASDYTITSTNAALGTLNGNVYTAGENGGKTNITVTLNANTAVSKTIPLTVGKGSEVIFDFEEGSESADLSNWVIKDHEGKYVPYTDLSIVTNENGMVHNGETALAVHMPTHTRVDGGEGYNANSITWVGDRILLENATAIGLWVYIPEEATQTEIALNYVWYNDKGVQQRTTPDLCLNDDFNDIEASGWYYLSVPISKSIAYIEDATSVAASQGYKRNFFLKFYVTNSGNAGDESSYSGDITYYIDDVTVDYSDAVADRVAPVYSGSYVKNIASELEVALKAGEAVAVNAGDLAFTATVTDNLAIDPDTVHVYVDGKEVSATYKNGRITSADVALDAGIHRVMFEIADGMGNVSKTVRYISVSGTEVAVNVVPKDPEADLAPTGSVYWLNVVAANAETVDKIVLKLDLDTMNEWQLDYAELAYNYSIEYYYANIAEENDNVITVVLTNNGSDITGEAVIASLPVRVWSYIGNATGSTLTPAEAWTKGYITAVSVNVEVEYGEVFYTDNSTSTFSAEKIHVDTEAYVHQYKMDKTYFANTTYHVHTAVAIEDLAATCTANGYTDRTVCEACASVVDWGTVVPATGHTLKVFENTLVCDCGYAETQNGFYTVDGNIYYLFGGALATEWQYIDVDGKTEYFYFDAATYAAATGETTIAGKLYTFDDAGKLVRGAFYTNSRGTQYYFGPTYTTTKWIELEEGTYWAGGDGYIAKGHYGLRPYVHAPIEWHEFDLETGLYIGITNGLGYTADGKLIYAENGVPVNGAVALEDGIIFSSVDGYVTVDGTCYIGTTLDSTAGLESGYYYCGTDGYIVANGFVKAGNYTFYFTDYVRAKGFTKIGDDYYLFNAGSGMMYTDKTMWVGANAYGIEAGSYYFQPDGKMYIPNPEGEKEIVEEDGKLYIYIDGVKQTSGLYEIDGDYYYATSSGALATGVAWVSKTNDLMDRTGYYQFGDDGKMMATGFMTTPEGYTYYFDNYVILKGLTKIGDDYYLFNAGSGNMYRDANMWVGSGNPYGFEPAAYYFQADGRMYIPDLVNGEKAIVEEDGVLYFTIDGMKQKNGLYELDGDYYFATSTGALATDEVVWVSKTNDYVVKAYYKFEADGKMMKTGFMAAPTGYTYYFKDGEILKTGLTLIDGAYYMLNTGSGRIYMDANMWVSSSNAYGFEAGTYYFMPDGKMYIPDLVNGEKAIIEEDGVLYFTIDGFVQKNGLYELDGEFYYATNTGALATDTTIWVSKTNDLVENADYYRFAEDGKLVKTGFYVSPGNGYTYYRDNLVIVKGFTKLGDDYYFFNAGSGRMYTDTYQWVSGSNPYGIKAGSYYFGADGKMIVE